MRSCKTWIEEEDLFLENNIGRMKIETISDQMGRSISAIKQRMAKLNLRTYENTVDINLHQFSKMTGIYSGTLYWWVDNNNLPARKKHISEKGYVLVISVEDWWKWAENNKNLIDFTTFKAWTLGDVPDWVEEQKELDKSNISKQNGNKKLWTEKDKKKLESMCKQYKYTAREIGLELGRTESAVLMQVYRLKIKEWPLKSEQSPWSKEEKQKVRELYKEGHRLASIADKLGRSQQSVRRKYLKVKEEVV